MVAVSLKKKTPLVVAYALAGRVDIDLSKEPIGVGKNGMPVFLRDLWPTSHEIHEEIKRCLEPKMFKERYAHIMRDNPVWDQIEMKKTAQYGWDPKSTYIQQPPYFEQFTLDLPPQKELKNMRALALFGDSVTTDHISPAGAFSEKTPAGQYLRSLGVKLEDFNSYGSRRGNHNVMMRGTFANVRIMNKMAGGQEGGVTKMEGKIVPIFEACQTYAEKKIPLIIFAGKDYGMGSSRDWAAKGTALLGVRVVVARSFERIHRSNLIGMGVLPLEFQNDASFESLGITGDETFSIKGLQATPQHTVKLEMTQGGKSREVPLTVRLDTPIEVEYYRHGGIMPYVLRSLLE